MNIVKLPEINSTNSYLLQSLAKGETWAEESVVYTLKQTAGRGQPGNSWESEPGKNIAFSLLLRPTMVPVNSQFVISELTCLGIVDALDILLGGSYHAPISIKWPNDIYAGDEKICGILIENTLMGATISNSVIGVGINVNQLHWEGNAPNPTSMCILAGNREFDPETVLKTAIAAIGQRYKMLKFGGSAKLHTEFIDRLYRREGFFPYRDAESNEDFEARIIDVEPTGHILLEEPSGKTRRYSFKEVKFRLPCGVTKE